jgi:hypothetical protein
LWQWRSYLAKQNPTAGLAVGFDKWVIESEPNRRAGKRVQQQVQI